MIALCKCCVEESRKQACVNDAKNIVSALLSLWRSEFGNGPYSGRDQVGGYLCWDWASGFNSIVNNLNSTVWVASPRKFAAPSNSKGKTPVHYAVRISIMNPQKVDCEISVDDGFFQDGLVHTPGWPTRRDYKEDFVIPDLPPGTLL
jgi:hypothetical protein